MTKYNQMVIRSLIPISILIFSLSLISCGGNSGDGGAPITASQAEDKLPKRLKAAEKSVSKLKSAIDQGQLRNTTFIKEYARVLKADNPKLTTLVDNLATDATSNGALYKNLQSRLDTLKNDPELFETSLQRYQEANALIDAAQPGNFNNSLTDVINVLADMSNGALARVGTQEKADSLSTNRAQDLGAGSQLIGNPSYGQWSNHGGTSVWEWYGMYAMFRDLTGGRNYSYNQWDRGRDWSYHNDVARDRYGNTRTKSQNKPTKKRYGSSRDYGTSRKSYGSSSTDRRVSSFSNKSSGSKSSSFSKKSSSFGGSFRNKSTYSRSSFSFGGK